MNKLYIILSLLLTVSCSEHIEGIVISENDIDTTQIVQKKQRPNALKNGKFFKVNKEDMLYGGETESDHFIITNSILEETQFHYGIGREVFPALLEPEFISILQADSIWVDSTRFLLAHSGDDIKAYSIKDLTRHEIVNDMLNGKPIMAVYCILADLGAIYERTYGDKVLTFGLSGYTYYDPEVWNGVDGFVFWDRETESLWWPLIGKAVSGPLLGVGLQEMNKENWIDTDWKTIKDSYPTAKILRSEQDYERPETWTKYSDISDITDNFSLGN